MPKNLFGIVGATSVCDTIRHKTFGDVRIKKAPLFIVVSTVSVGKPHSIKRGQFKLVENQLADGVGSVSSVSICTDDEFALRFKL